VATHRQRPMVGVVTSALTRELVEAATMVAEEVEDGAKPAVRIHRCSSLFRQDSEATCMGSSNLTNHKSRGALRPHNCREGPMAVVSLASPTL
jgi:hypothetical protein